MRRFALLLYHRVTGFMANGMCCWQVPIEAIDHHGGANIAGFMTVADAMLAQGIV